MRTGYKAGAFNSYAHGVAPYGDQQTMTLNTGTSGNELPFGTSADRYCAVLLFSNVSGLVVDEVKVVGEAGTLGLVQTFTGLSTKPFAMYAGPVSQTGNLNVQAKVTNAGGGDFTVWMLAVGYNEVDGFGDFEHGAWSGYSNGGTKAGFTLTTAAGDTALVLGYSGDSATLTADSPATDLWTPGTVGGPSGTLLSMDEVATGASTSIEGSFSDAGFHFAEIAGVVLTKAAPSGTTHDTTLTEAATAAEATTSIIGTLADVAEAATAADVCSATVTPAASGTLTTEPLVRNNGTVAASSALNFLALYDQATGALVLRATGLSTNGAGVATVTHAAIVAGTTYRVDWEEASGQRRMPLKAAT